MLSWVKVNETCRLNYLMRKIWFGGEAALPTFLDKQNKLQSTSCCQRNVFQTLWSNEASALSPSGPGWTSLCFLCILQFWAFPKMSNSFSTLGLQCFLSRPGLFVLFTQREALCGDVIPGLLLPKSLYSWHTRTRSHYLETWLLVVPFRLLPPPPPPPTTATRVSKQRASTRFVSYQTDGGANS